MRLSETEWYLNDFLIFCQSKNLSQKTISSYEQSLNLFLLWLKNEQDIDEVQRVKTGHIRQYIAYMQERGKYTVVKREESLNTNHPYKRKDYNKTVSNVTINNYIRNIKVFFNWLHDEGEIRKNPVDGIKTIKTERKQKAGITKQEFQKLLDAFDYTKYYGYRNKMIILLLQDTGARIGEALAIDTDDMDFKHRMILMRHTKSRQERYVYFSQQLACELKHYIQFKDRFTDSSLLFTTTRGTPVTVSSFEKQLKKTCELAGVSVHPHQLRNNFARQYLLNGGDIFTLSKILGHSSVQVTEQAYMDLTREEIAKKYHEHSPLAKWKVR